MKHTTKDKNPIIINRTFFDFALKEANILIKKGKYESAAIFLRYLSFFVWSSPTGYFCSWKLEQLLTIIGQHIIPKEKSVSPLIKDTDKLNILHIATQIFEVGGHTQLLFNWTRLDNKNKHHIILTEQSLAHLPIEKTSKENYDLSLFSSLEDQSNNILEKATLLRKYASQYDLVVLHIHPSDVIPSIAFSTEDLPPVLFLNHADHLYWTGASTIDVLLQIREFNIIEDKKRRGILQEQFFLPIPIPDNESNVDINKKRLYCREKLNIDKDKIVLLSTGTEYKFKPNKSHNLFEITIPILNENPNVILFIVGISEKSNLAQQYAHSQIRYVGELQISDLEAYEWASDIYLETMPFASFTAMLEVGLKKKAIHLMHNPNEMVRLFSDSSAFKYSNTKEEWQKGLRQLISDTSYRSHIRELQFEYLKKEYTTSAWIEKLNHIYDFVKTKKHKNTHNESHAYAKEDDIDFLLSITPHYKIGAYSFCLGLSYFQRLRFFRFLVKNKPQNILLRKRDIVLILSIVNPNLIIKLIERIFKINIETI